jgi:hypothetical protein
MLMPDATLKLWQYSALVGRRCGLVAVRCIGLDEGLHAVALYGQSAARRCGALADWLPSLHGSLHARA